MVCKVDPGGFHNGQGVAGDGKTVARAGPRRFAADSAGMRILYEFPEKSLAHGAPAGIARAYKQDVHRDRPPLKLT